ncbi:MAG: hypothetical protein WBC04_07315 [Candidatus Acidiferrales bacterium]|jgi:hypothetical protein
MCKWLTFVVLVLLTFTVAMGLSGLSARHSGVAGWAPAPVWAHSTGPVPPTPW